MHIDIETSSSADLKKVGVNYYAKDASTELLLLADAKDDRPVRVTSIPEGEKVSLSLFPTDYTLVAHNAMFENTVLSNMGFPVNIERWECTMAMALAAGLPADLGTLGAALGLSDDLQKDRAGKRLIDFFSKPLKPTKANGMIVKHLWFDDLDKWKQFKEYNRQDVVTEREIHKELLRLGYKMPDKERQLWLIDCKMNSKGLCLDYDLAVNCHAIYERYKRETKQKITEISGIKNPNSPAQVKAWVESYGVHVASLDKEHVAELLEQDIPDIVKEVLTLKANMSKTSLAKFDRALEMAVEYEHGYKVCDGLQYSGAGRTARWAGRGVQMHNLPSNKLEDEDLTYVRDLAKNGTYEDFMAYTDQPLHALTELVRTMFIPEPGKVFAIADYSAIEARVIAWLANETWRLDVFNSHGKIYEASASTMFGVPIDTIAKGQPNEDLRKKGKVAELALGYQGGEGALIVMGALKMGLHEHELEPLVRSWRASNRNIVKLWYEVDEKAKFAISNKTQVRLTHRNVWFTGAAHGLVVTLPSGRNMTYWHARVVPSKTRPNSTQIEFKNVTEKGRKWLWTTTYGGKLVENITQAIARDCLAEALLKVDKCMDVRFHVHDEIITQVDADTASEDLERLIGMMREVPDWATSLPLNAEGYFCEYYKKG